MDGWKALEASAVSQTLLLLLRRGEAHDSSGPRASMRSQRL